MRKHCFGATFRFLSDAWENRPYSRSELGHLAKMILRVFLLTPGCIYEKWFNSNRIAQQKIHPNPVFILGHPRSGTTFLHKIMASDPQFVYLDGMDAIFPYKSQKTKDKMRSFVGWVLRKLKVKNEAFNDYQLELDDPIEEDAYWLYVNCQYSVFWGLVFPRNANRKLSKYIVFENEETEASWKSAYLYLCKKISAKRPEFPLLLKSPPNTGRVRTLLELFPNAKFIHIYRNPYIVYSSMEKLIVENIQKNYSLHKISNSQIQDVILKHYSLLMDQLEKDKQLLNESNFIEMSYEEIMTEPLDKLEKIYNQLNLGSFSEAQPHFKTLLNKESNYRPSSHNISDHIKMLVDSAWAKHLKRLGYL